VEKASWEEGEGRSRARPAAEAKLVDSLAAAGAVKAETPGQLVQALPLHQADPGAVPSDIAESKRREHRLAGIIASAMDAIITIGERNEITLINPAAEEMFGYSEAELLGKPLSMLIPGYSSLNYLKHFRVDKLKIDQSFMRGIPADPGDLAIVTSLSS
jgi:PAS domain-containing protein